MSGLKFKVALGAVLVLAVTGIASASTITGVTDHSFTVAGLACGTHYAVTLKPDGGSTENKDVTTKNCPDTTPPVATVTNPTANQTVSGTINLTADATDPTPPPPPQNVSGVASVQFVLDGNTVGAPDTSAPYSVPLDTTTLANGAHTLTAVATDNAGTVGASQPVSFTVSNQTPLPNITLPVRGTFFYPWYPETWYANQHFNPSLGNYDSSSLTVIDQQLDTLDYAHIGLSSASWWGQGSTTDGRISTLLNETNAHGSNVKWSLYYEPEGIGNPTVAQIQSDLSYINNHYGGNPAFARIGGKPVVFVYADSGDNCGMADRWKQANDGLGDPDYVVLKVFSGYASCASQPDNWHQYGPAVRSEQHGTHAYYVSPGFWFHGAAAPQLERDSLAFASAVRAMQAANVDFRLIETFNEWGEGTAIESATQWSSASGFGVYADILHNDGTNPPVNILGVTRAGTGTGTVTSDPAGINCGGSPSTCTAAFGNGSIVALTARPAAGSTFTGWTGGCTGTATVCYAKVNGAQVSVTATFSGS